MIFKVIYSRYLPGTLSKNTCYLLFDPWNDYKFQTSFSLHYVDVNNAARQIGDVKIMQRGQTTEGYTQLDETFKKLNEDFCSLGQGQSYYEELMNLPAGQRIEILTALKDCVYDPKIFSSFREEAAMQASLLRSVSVINVGRRFKAILDGNAIPTSYHFQYLMGETPDNILEVRVTPDSMPPSNVHVIIGRNGVGKSRLLAGIANNLTGKQEDTSYGIPGEINFPDDLHNSYGNYSNQDSFANLVTVAFSAFDRFEPIKNGDLQHIKYSYIGLKSQQNPTEFLSTEDLKQSFRISLEKCLTIGNKRKRWIKALEILNSDPVFKDFELVRLVDSKNSFNKIAAVYDTLSSGHRIIILTITRLIELVDEKSLVLIDEPETHLHPPLLSSFMRVVSDLLTNRNGIAIIATHSPVILQEVPKTCVTIIDRVQSSFSLYKPEIETFGENVGTLTREVFNLEVLESGFYTLIKNNLQNNSYDEMLEDFDFNLGSEAKAIARSIKKNQSDSDA